MRRRTGLPLTSTRSPNEMRWPVCAGSPLTVMRPSWIGSSMSRREPTPACASTLCSLGASGSGARTRLLAISFALGLLGDFGVELAGHHLGEDLGRLDRSRPAGDGAAAALRSSAGSGSARGEARARRPSPRSPRSPRRAVAPVATPAALAGGGALAVARRHRAASPPCVAVVGAAVASPGERAPPISARRRLRRRARLGRASPTSARRPTSLGARDARRAGGSPAAPAAARLATAPRRGVAPSSDGDGAIGVSGADRRAARDRAGAFMRAVPGHLHRQGDGRPEARPRHRPRARRSESSACDSPSAGRPPAPIGSPSAPSSVGSCSSVARPRSSRNWRVVASSAGRPGASR